MSLIVTLQRVYADYFSLDMSKNVNYTTKPGYQDVLEIARRYNEPKDDIERAYCQYLCSVSHLGMGKRAVINILAALLILPYLIKMRLAKNPKREIADAVFLAAEHISDGVIPRSIMEQYPRMVHVVPECGMKLNAGSLKHLCSVMKRTPFHPYFHLKVAIKLGFLVHAMQKYEPKAIIHNTESSFACSVLTSYCESTGVPYIGVMHGEYLVNPKDAFFRCSKFYVWDSHYEQMLKGIRCYANQFVIEAAPNLDVRIVPVPENERVDYIFYLQKESEEELKRLSNSFCSLRDKGYSVLLRPHPKFFDNELYVNYFGPEVLSCLDTDPLNRSLSKTRCAVGRFTTVLYQAYRAGLEVVIDDITNPELIDYLQRANYVMLNKPHRLLSEIVY